MNQKLKTTGFTLIELLIATTITVIIISVAFGSNIIITSSVGEVSGSIENTLDNERILQSVSRQLRSMLPPDGKEEDKPETNRLEVIQKPEDIFVFNNRPSQPTGILLSFISTHSILDHPVNAPVKTNYKIDTFANKLTVSEQLYMPEAGAIENSEESKAILSGVQEISAEFYDGTHWQRNWAYTDHDSLPRSIKINITLEAENGAVTDYKVTAPVLCSAIRSREIEIESKADNL